MNFFNPMVCCSDLQLSYGYARDYPGVSEKTLTPISPRPSKAPPPKSTGMTSSILLALRKPRSRPCYTAGYFGKNPGCPGPDVPGLDLSQDWLKVELLTT